MSQRILDKLKERFGDAIGETHSRLGDDTAYVARERIVEIMAFLRDDPELLLDMPSDLTGVDWLTREPRFEVVYHLYSIKKKHRVRIKCRVPEDDATIPSVTSVYPGLNWFERETWDMFGIRFEGHPDLRRMFMYEQFVGHPLRKDYPKEKRQPLIRRDGSA
jgi:NADH-quinone oxidoreductase subunit C